MALQQTSFSIDEFSPAAPTSWPLYLERLEFLFIAQNVETAEQKRSILCTVCEAETYRLLRSLCVPKAPFETPYTDIVAKLNDHFVAKPSVTLERFRSNKRAQLSELRCCASSAFSEL